MPTPGHPGTPRPTAGRPAEGIDAMLARLERFIARQERTPATGRDATHIRLARMRLHLMELRLQAIDTAAE